MKLPPGRVPGVGIVKLGAYGGFGQKMLEKMGWSMGEGLGTKRDGLKEAIKTKHKTDTYGLGMKKDSEWDISCWEQIYEKGLEGFEKVSGDSRSKTAHRRKVRKMTGLENPDGTTSSAGMEELHIYKRLSKRTHLGKWSSRNGKLDRIKKQEQQSKDSPSNRTNQRDHQPQSVPRTKSELVKPDSGPSLNSSKKRKACIHP